MLIYLIYFLDVLQFYGSAKMFDQETEVNPIHEIIAEYFLNHRSEEDN